jgi:hypothetical protein
MSYGTGESQLCDQSEGCTSQSIPILPEVSGSVIADSPENTQSNFFFLVDKWLKV